MTWLTILSCALMSLAFRSDFGGQSGALDDAPRTTAESSNYKMTSTAQDVRDFLKELRTLEHGHRLRESVIGTTEEGREILAVTVADPMPNVGERVQDGRLRLLVNANIHAGEVEGKEAVQQMLREFAQGEHADLLRDAVLLFIPIYNVDGNERIDRNHRVSQNGPDGGVGTRENSNGRCLNRDFVKTETAECRALMGLIREQDPHLFMDLHTTNGSNHGYHLTYSPSLSTNVNAELNSFERSVLLPEVGADVLSSGDWRIFDYGNFGRGEETPRTWSTYDHRPRFGTNYYSMRNRLSVLSEAYSYIDFERRIGVTYAFTLSVLTTCARHREAILKLCDTADRQAMDSKQAFPFATHLEPGEEGQILVGVLDSLEIEDIGTRRIARDEFSAEPAILRRAFESDERIALPAAWAIPAASEAVLASLRTHGVEHSFTSSETACEAETFALSEVRRAERPFQGHLEMTFPGQWSKTSVVMLPVGTCVIPAKQRLSRVAAQLLEPTSEDSLGTWGILIPEVKSGADPVAYPVLRLTHLP